MEHINNSHYIHTGKNHSNSASLKFLAIVSAATNFVAKEKVTESQHKEYQNFELVTFLYGRWPLRKKIPPETPIWRLVLGKL